MNAKLPLIALLFVFAGGPALHAGTDALVTAQKIDALLAADWQRHSIKPNAPASDEVLVRRLHLDIVGRIPTLEETRAFLASTDPAKRARLIDELLASDGYASHMFNFFADLLRITDAGGKSKITAEAYAEWMKARLRDDTPYDRMVHEMLSSHGLASDTGAIGYYARDENKLDNLAYTSQVFLGTQIVCAQCHNHPFDKWTQMDFYGMAAYTHGVNPVGASLDLIKMPPGAKQKGVAVSDLVDVRKAIQGALQPLKYASTRYDERRVIDLPQDYQYKDAKPGDAVATKTLFGRTVTPVEGETRIQAFADWMTAPENPRFTLVIANRMWKRVFGLGLIEPVDEIMDSSVASNPELMRALTQLMIEQRLSLKSFLRVLYNTQAYQRATSTSRPQPGEVFYFPGPLPRRMSAEQVWDSIVTLIHGNVDSRVSETNANLQKYLASLKLLSNTVKEKGLEGLTDIAKQAAAQSAEDEERIAKLRAEMNATGKAGKKEAQALNREAGLLREKSRTETMAAILGLPSLDGLGLDYKAQKREEKAVKMEKSRPTAMSRGDRKVQLQKNLASQFDDRAAELPSPSPPAHFLRTFGQSDRDTIENANPDATIPQALLLLNGPVLDALNSTDAALQKQLATASSAGDKIRLLYQTLLSREPSEQEKEVLREVLRERGESAIADVTHALLLGAEFIFVR